MKNLNSFNRDTKFHILPPLLNEQSCFSRIPEYGATKTSSYYYYALFAYQQLFSIEDLEKLISDVYNERLFSEPQPYNYEIGDLLSEHKVTKKNKIKVIRKLIQDLYNNFSITN